MTSSPWSGWLVLDVPAILVLAPPVDLGVGKAIANLGVEIGAPGFGQQQLLVSLFGNAEVLIDRPAAEFQLQQGQLVVVGSLVAQCADGFVAWATPCASGKPAVCPTLS